MALTSSDTSQQSSETASQRLPVVMIPSLGRPASDFLTVAPALEQAGFRLVLLDPRPHWHGSPTLHDLAADSLAQLDALEIRTFHLVGHAFGNRLARTIAADAPHRVVSLALLPQVGSSSPPPTFGQGWRSVSTCRCRPSNTSAKCGACSLPTETMRRCGVRAGCPKCPSISDMQCSQHLAATGGEPALIVCSWCRDSRT